MACGVEQSTRGTEQSAVLVGQMAGKTWRHEQPGECQPNHCTRGSLGGSQRVADEMRQITAVAV